MAGRGPATKLLVAMTAMASALLLPAPAFATDSGVEITSGPAEGATVQATGTSSDPTHSTQPVVFGFTVTGEDAATCSLDGEAPRACSTPTSDSLAGLVYGSHIWTVTAGGATASRTFTVVVSTLGDAPQAPAVLPRTTAHVTARWIVHGPRTRVRELRLSHLAHRARVNVYCFGRGCPSRHPEARTVSLRTRLTGVFAGSVLRPRAHIVIRVAQAGHRSKVFVFTTHRHARPTLRVWWLRR